MLSIETVLAFSAASALLAAAPGPDNIFVTTQSALRGKSAGLTVMLGLCTGLVVHSTAVALGVAAVFQTSAVAFAVLKFVGAGYLAWLAFQAFRAPDSEIRSEAGGETGLWKLYRRGIVMNVTNPKVSIFFLAFLPQFADPKSGPVWAQIFMLGGLFIVATILVFGAIALLAGTLGEWLNRSARVRKVMNKLAGTVFMALAIKLAISER